MAARSASKARQKDSYPVEIKKHGIAVKVYREEKPSRGLVYIVTYYQKGVRHRDSFRDEEKALKHAETTANALAGGKGESLTLGTVELESYRHAKQILDELSNPPPLHLALREYVATKQLLGEKPLLATLERFMAEEKAANLKPITVPDLVEKFITAKESDGLSDRYIKDCRIRLRRFGRDFQTQVAQVKTGEIDTWLRSLQQSPRSRNNFRVLIVTLFSFARSAGYLPKDRATEAGHVARAKDKGGAIEVFTCEELSRLLAASNEEVMPYLVLGAFAGIRTAESMRLTWDCIRFDRKVIEIKAGMAKTAQRRLIPLSDNLAAWLQKVAKPNGKVITLARPEKTASEVVAASCEPAIPWKRNELRHSYASYRLEILQDAGKLALEMGNSPSMIFSNYRELVDEEDAKNWFKILPKMKEADGEQEVSPDEKEPAIKVSPDDRL